MLPQQMERMLKGVIMKAGCGSNTPHTLMFLVKSFMQLLYNECCDIGRYAIEGTLWHMI